MRKRRFERHAAAVCVPHSVFLLVFPLIHLLLPHVFDGSDAPLLFSPQNFPLIRDTCRTHVLDRRVFFFYGIYPKKRKFTLNLDSSESERERRMKKEEGLTNN